MNTFGLRPEFQIPIAARDFASLHRLGLPRTISQRRDGSVCAAVTKPLSTMFAHFRAGATLIPSGSDISVDRYRELVDQEQLWISPDAENYRGVYAAWHPTPTLPAGYDVDHALSKALAVHFGYAYVRLTLVEKQANRSAGSSGEKLGLMKGRTPSELGQLAREPLLYADPSDLAKLLNVAHGNSNLAGVADFQQNNRFIFS